MTLTEFERQAFAIALASPICGIPVVRRLTSTSINLRVEVTIGGFIDAFYNEQTATMAYALIQQGKRTFGADNTGGWHVHPLMTQSGTSHCPACCRLPSSWLKSNGMLPTPTDDGGCSPACSLWRCAKRYG